MAHHYSFIWSLEDDTEGNFDHIDLHGITVEEWEEVFLNPYNETSLSRSTSRPIRFGWTSTGRYIAIVWEELPDDPLTIIPVTAYIPDGCE